MRICFFGHRDTPMETEEKLKKILDILLQKGESFCFYIGQQGNFDDMALRVLEKMKKKFPKIEIVRVIAYLEEAQNGIESLYPEGLETVPRKFAIVRRNEWMVDHADLIIVYLSRSFGGAAKAFSYAKRKGKKIINLYE